MFCTACGYAITGGGRFCTACGTPLAANQAPENSIICRYCNFPAPANAHTCTNCGSPLAAEQAPREESAPPARQNPLSSETVIEALHGRLMLREGKTMFLPGKFVNGYWIFTGKSMLFYFHDWDELDELELDGRTIGSLDKDNIVTGAYYKEIHSIRVQKGFIDSENDIYLYDGDMVCAEFDNKPQKQFMALLERFIPGLTILKKGIADYNPSISEMDPRNPHGTRYDPSYPRAYVVASTKGFPEKRESMQEAVNAAKRDGTLPSNFNLAFEAAGFSKEKPIPGVPVVFDGML